MEEIVIGYKWVSPNDLGNSCVAYVDMNTKKMYVCLSKDFNVAECRKITNNQFALIFEQIKISTKDSFVKLMTALRNSGFQNIYKEKGD